MRWSSPFGVQAEGVEADGETENGVAAVIVGLLGNVN
jgi:hypothetical protein